MFSGFLGWFLRRAGQIPLDRFHTDPRRGADQRRRAARRAARSAIFPEGARGAGELDALPPRRGLPGDGHRSTGRAGDHLRHPRARAARVRHCRRSVGPSTWCSVRRSPSSSPRGRGRASTWGTPPADCVPACSTTSRPPDAAPASPFPGPCPQGSTNPTPAGASRRSQHEQHTDRRDPARAARRPRTDEPRGSGAGPGCRRTPQRRQVDAGQPHHRPSCGRRRGRARRDPRPRLLRRQLERSRLHRRRHRWLGPRRPWPRAADRRARPRSRSASPTPSSSWSTRPSASPTSTRRSSRSSASRASPSSWPPTRSTTSAPRPRPTRCGTSGLGEPMAGLGAARTRLGRHARRRSSPRCRSRREMTRHARRRSPPDRDRRQAQRRQVLAAEQARRSRTASSSTTSPAPPSTRSTSSSSSAGAPGASSTPPASASGSRRPRATSTTPRCAPRPRSTAPRWPCWSSTAASRSPSRTCGSSRRSARPAGRW